MSFRFRDRILYQLSSRKLASRAKLYTELSYIPGLAIYRAKLYTELSYIPMQRVIYRSNNFLWTYRFFRFDFLSFQRTICKLSLLLSRILQSTRF